MKTLLGIEVSDDYFDELFCGQAQGKTIVARDGQLVLEERSLTFRLIRNCDGNIIPTSANIWTRRSS